MNDKMCVKWLEKYYGDLLPYYEQGVRRSIRMFYLKDDNIIILYIPVNKAVFIERSIFDSLGKMFSLPDLAVESILRNWIKKKYKINGDNILGRIDPKKANNNLRLVIKRKNNVKPKVKPEINYDRLFPPEEKLMPRWLDKFWRIYDILFAGE